MASIHGEPVSGYARQFGHSDNALAEAEEWAAAIVGTLNKDGVRTAYHIVEVGPFVFRTAGSGKSGTIWVVDTVTLAELDAGGAEFKILTTEGLDEGECPALEITASINDGDGGTKYAAVIIGEVKVTVYESLTEPGRVVVDIETETDKHLEQSTSLAVTINDHYIHGEPL